MNDSRISLEFPVTTHEGSAVQLLLKIFNQCADIKAELKDYREESQRLISQLNVKVEALSVIVKEQKNIIHALITKQQKRNSQIVSLITFNKISFPTQSKSLVSTVHPRKKLLKHSCRLPHRSTTNQKRKNFGNHQRTWKMQRINNCKLQKRHQNP